MKVTKLNWTGGQNGTHNKILLLQLGRKVPQVAIEDLSEKAPQYILLTSAPLLCASLQTLFSEKNLVKEPDECSLSFLVIEWLFHSLYQLNRVLRSPDPLGLEL